MQVFDDTPPLLYETLHSLMLSLLCDPALSPFLTEVPPTGVAMSSSSSLSSLSSPSCFTAPADGIAANCDKRSEPGGPDVRRNSAVVSWPRPLLAGLACLGAHEDLRQRGLVLVRSGLVISVESGTKEERRSSLKYTVYYYHNIIVLIWRSKISVFYALAGIVEVFSIMCDTPQRCLQSHFQKHERINNPEIMR